MPKPYTFPTLYNDALQIDINKLKRWGYLKANQEKKGTLNWSRNGNLIGSITIIANTIEEKPYIVLDYNYKGDSRHYQVYIGSKLSNLNKAKIEFFICPKTNKHCRKLYSIGGMFLHREAFKGCMYESQTKSKAYRELERLYIDDSLYNELNKKYFKQTYAGMPTKRYLSIMNKINKVERLLYSYPI